MADLSERAKNALKLATRAGRRLGLAAREPRVLYDVFNVQVHLAPDPVVVRVPSLTFSSADEQAARQRRELAVVGWLADRGAPVVPPSPLVPREPVECDDRSLTFWEYVDERDSIRDARPEELEGRFAEQTGWVAELHRLMADCPVELPVLTPLVPGVEQLLSRLRAHRPEPLTAADLDRAEREYAVAETLAGDLTRYFPGARPQTLHGDSPPYNVLLTAHGHLFGDFEDVTRGPVEWDLAGAGPRAVEEYERAGGRRVDPELLAWMERARLLQAVAALALATQMPELGPMLEPLLAQWREHPPLTLEKTG
ncbi:aminoglycoside phosphotransferase family protein [Nonomuraea sp. K274]|uniref:Aminoglycoside phosphotransferase family protein n=1 Tax=Nonomuraea cypriaca TaxID=1187855 RepID=A0A931A553_9ACTN|nr:aminoglycoside phosphotransferase family protein [Nonomuraea cypriaca]MBF8186391.1 aminoglycoside phosphotransferase family protein [Nonomuraea cypriaca]